MSNFLAPTLGAFGLLFLLFLPQTAFAFSFDSSIYTGTHKLNAIDTEHFMIEFSRAVKESPDLDYDGVADLLEEIAEYAEYSWDKEVEELGLPSPLDDQDKVYLILDDRDFYISEGTLGVTGLLPNGEIYIAIDPALSDEYLQVTVAHEFFHAIQFGYQGYFAGYDQDINFAEATATWSEDYVYDDVNDYHNYLYHYFDHTDYSIFTGVIPDGSLFEYALSIWPVFLSEYYADWSLIGDVVNAYFYEEIPDVWDAYEAYREVIADQGDDLRDVYMSFAYWNYLTSFYEEGDQYPYVDIHSFHFSDEYPIEEYSVWSSEWPALFGVNYLQFLIDSDQVGSDLKFTFFKDAGIDLGVVVLPESDDFYLTEDEIWTIIEAGDVEGTITLPIEDDHVMYTVMVMPLSSDVPSIESDLEAFGYGYEYYYSAEIGDYLGGDTYEVDTSETSEVEVTEDDSDKEGDEAGENLGVDWTEEAPFDELTVTELEITSVTDDSVLLNWTRVEAENAAGYYVNYGTQSGYYDFYEMIEGAHVTHATISDLPEGTYYFMVTGYDEDYYESGYNSNEVEANVAGVNFTDIYQSHRNYEAIKFMVYLGVIEGYEDGTFKPNKEINRAELMKLMVYGWLGEAPDVEDYNNCFPDVTDEWFAPYVCYAQEEEWVQGYTDGNFYPANIVSKVEALKMILESYGIEVPETAILRDLPYDDVYSSAWYAPYLKTAYDMGLLEETGNSFNPNDGRTRAEVSEEIFRLLVLDTMWADVFNEDILDVFLEIWGEEFL